MKIAACIVTRGNVPLHQIRASIPLHWETVIYDNSGQVTVNGEAVKTGHAVVPDLAVYGRYAAIESTDADLIYVQDDDAVLEPEGLDTLLAAYEPGKLVANMPERFRHDFYRDHCLVGFGALFDRDLPELAFNRFCQRWGATIHGGVDIFHRTCDVVFTTLTERILVDVSHLDLPWASTPDRMWKQTGHQAERAQVLNLARAAQ